ncbi:MAG: hypothetical protein HY748_06690 [Elusimicrobia bacterium]|nr:hypothetical protein [Elusimicrobiota bacterium]
MKRWAVMAEFYRMVRDRRAYILIPILLAIGIIMLFLFTSEMPLLIPFFYAVF